MELGAPVTLQVTTPLTAMAPSGLDAPAVGDGPRSRGGRPSSAASASRHRGARHREARRSMVVAFPAAADLLARQPRRPAIADSVADLLLPERRRPLHSCCCRPPPNLHLPGEAPLLLHVYSLCNGRGVSFLLPGECVQVSMVLFVIRALLLIVVEKTETVCY
jgi:hypothetical protein